MMTAEFMGSELSEFMGSELSIRVKLNGLSWLNCKLVSIHEVNPPATGQLAATGVN